MRPAPSSSCAAASSSGASTVSPGDAATPTLKAAIETMLRPESRRHMRANCHRLAAANGAAAAATLIAEQLHA